VNHPGHFSAACLSGRRDNIAAC